MNKTDTIRDAFRFCERITKSHYENFPVASLAIPRTIRPYIYSVYAFARTADDFADEGTMPADERLAALDDWQMKLDQCPAGESDHPVFIALGETLRATGLPKQLFTDLLTAFRLDVITTRFSSFRNLLDYCGYSANPVGRIILILFGEGNERNFINSDKICSALQITNFLQDISVDMKKGRIYIPLEDISAFRYTEARLLERECDEAFRNLMRFQVGRTRELFEEGKSLVGDVHGRLQWELNLTVRGGMAILDAIETRGFDVLACRPTLSKGNKLSVLLSSIFFGKP